MLSFQKAWQGFKLHAQIANHSPRTISWYDDNLAAFQRYLLAKYPQQDADHLLISDITRDDVQQYIASLQERETVYENHKFRAPIGRKLSPYTIHGHVRALSHFFHWLLSEKLIETSPMDGVPRPKVPKSIKDRLSESDIKKLLKVCDECREPLAARNRALILFLLDTGVRASELCGLTVDRLDEQFRRAHITGKGLKDRFVPLGARTREAMWSYVHVYRPAARQTNAVFLTAYGRPLDKDKLAHILRALGKRADVMPCNPHKFRHTAARLYLRNGGDVLTLQQLLGHETLEVTRIYAQIEREDLERTHERVSPVDRMGL